MASEQFKPGDVVQLRSGGPPMTVTGEDELGEIICIWFEGTKKNSSSFPAEALKPHEKPKGGSFTLSRG